MRAVVQRRLRGGAPIAAERWKAAHEAQQLAHAVEITRLPVVREPGPQGHWSVM
ncbi:MAG TPA: hypothetical protein VN648_24065 [Candidatus Methylomirabilis sp.]|nr:hypothetical protein [Candidatus Methylomirabilis sp.]